MAPMPASISTAPMTPIQAATATAADLLGWTADVGAVAPGRHTDLSAVKADPIADIAALEAVDHVMQGGVLVR